MRAKNQNGMISRKLIILLSIPLFLVLLCLGLGMLVRFKYEHARDNWMEATLPKLAILSITNQEISQELNSLKDSQGAGGFPRWTDQQVLLMTNGEYLIFAFRHGFNMGLVDHLFLAHDSNGHWYYSTYHFCNNMAAVMIDPPPASIAEFTNKYSVREFDGKSNVCLQHTWP